MVELSAITAGGISYMRSTIRGFAMRAALALASVACILPAVGTGTASAHAARKPHRVTTTTRGITVSPNPVRESSISGDVFFTVHGRRLPALGSFTLSQTTGCLGGVTFRPSATVMSDYNGRIAVGAEGSNCARGTYVIAAQENFAPYHTFYATFRIQAP